MATTSREIVRKALRFERPPRLPVNFGCFQQQDTAWLPVVADPAFEASQPGEDEWGCVWETTDLPNMGQVKGHPLEDIAKLGSHRFPHYDRDERYHRAPEALEAAEDQGKYVVANIFMVLFERMHTLHGFENVMMDLLIDRPAMEALADRIVETQLNFVENVFRRFGGRVDGFSMTDDWGTQQAAFISVDLWIDFFFPRYKRMFDAMHAGGCDVFVHSCGKVNEIIEGLIQAGVDGVNLQQPRALGIEAIGRRYRGRITFDSLADIQQTLPTGDKSKIDEDVHALMEHWATPEGGFIFSDYGDDAAIGVPGLEVKRYMYDRFSHYSRKLYGEPLPEPVVAEPAG